MMISMTSQLNKLTLSKNGLLKVPLQLEKSMMRELRLDQQVV